MRAAFALLGAALALAIFLGFVSLASSKAKVRLQTSERFYPHERYE